MKVYLNIYMYLFIYLFTHRADEQGSGAAAAAVRGRGRAGVRAGEKHEERTKEEGEATVAPAKTNTTVVHTDGAASRARCANSAPKERLFRIYSAGKKQRDGCEVHL